MMSTMQPISLNKQQEAERDRFIEILEQAWLQIEQLEKKQSATYENPFEKANCFGIFGQRGAGKTTLLRSIFNKVREEKKNEEDPHFVFLPPIDCSAIPPMIAPSTAVYHTIAQFFEREDSHLSKSFADKFKGIAGRFMVSTRDSLNLNMELSGSVNEFAQNVMNFLDGNAKLSQEIRKLFIEVFEKKKPFKAFVIFLDDFDLIPRGEDIRRWLQALLDELHQSRLLIVVAADLYRLQYLSLGDEQQFDAKTGNALVYKIIPTANRLLLDRWGPKELVEFEKNNSPKITQLLCRQSNVITNHLQLISRLLPSLPRGLSDFWTSLSRATEKQKQLQNHNQGLRQFLNLLASCRQEDRLARKLMENSPLLWVKKFKFDENNCPEENWQEAVSAATQRADTCHEGDIFSKLNQGLIPETVASGKDSSNPESDSMLQDLLGQYHQKVFSLNPIQILSPVNPYKNQSVAQEVKFTVDASVKMLQNQEARTFPLRDLRQEKYPLRDAKTSHIPFWTELLMNIGFADHNNQGQIAQLKNRLQFFTRWVPFSERLKKAAITQKRAKEKFLDYIDDSYLLPTTASFFSAQIEEHHSQNEGFFHLHFGWRSLFQVMRGNFEQTPTYYRVPDYEPNFLSNQSELKNLKILPAELWAMILLVEGINRCPWQALSHPSNWLPSTLIVLAAALVRSAYVYALCECKILKETQLEQLYPMQKAFFDVLKYKDPANLLRKQIATGYRVLQEEEMQKDLQDLFNEDIQEALKGTDSLSQAAKAYFVSDAYKAAKDISF